jgi:hypothetical protein
MAYQSHAVEAVAREGSKGGWLIDKSGHPT